MKPSVYIETTVISYLTARPHRDIVVAGHQQATRDWWETAHEQFHVFASTLVASEASKGDPEAARERLEVLSKLSLLAITDDARTLAGLLVARRAVPLSMEEDALHLAIAATNGLDYLVTWNCRHLANATIRPLIELICRDWGCRSPEICTPEVLYRNL